MARKKKAEPWQLYHQDCLDGIAQQLPKGECKLAVYDPPYNIGQPYSDYVDRKTQREYLDFMEPRLSATYAHLHPHGSFWLAINTANQSELDIMCKQIGFIPRNKIPWFFTFGQNNAKGFTNAHVTWLYYTKHRTRFTFNADDPLNRLPSARQMVYNDKRANPKGRLPDNVWIIRPQQIPAAFEPHMDLWYFSRVCGTFKAKMVGVSPNQMPVPMLERIIRFCSNPGDLVCDAFLGTGTTGVAAVRMGRRFVGFDISKFCVQESEKRIAQAFDQIVPDDDVQLPLFGVSDKTKKGEK